MTLPTLYKRAFAYIDIFSSMCCFDFFSTSCFKIKLRFCEQCVLFKLNNDSYLCCKVARQTFIWQKIILGIKARENNLTETERDDFGVDFSTDSHRTFLGFIEKLQSKQPMCQCKWDVECVCEYLHQHQQLVGDSFIWYCLGSSNEWNLKAKIIFTLFWRSFIIENWRHCLNEKEMFVEVKVSLR